MEEEALWFHSNPEKTDLSQKKANELLLFGFSQSKQ
jgi:hypothetical protein